MPASDPSSSQLKVSTILKKQPSIYIIGYENQNGCWVAPMNIINALIIFYNDIHGRHDLFKIDIVIYHLKAFFALNPMVWVMF
jgi:hypothetical protein